MHVCEHVNAKSMKTKTGKRFSLFRYARADIDEYIQQKSCDIENALMTLLIDSS